MVLARITNLFILIKKRDNPLFFYATAAITLANIDTSFIAVFLLLVARWLAVSVVALAALPAGLDAPLAPAENSTAGFSPAFFMSATAL